MHIRRLKQSVLATALVTLAACGDSTGPGSVTADEAFRSLARGFGPGSGVSLPLGISPTTLGSAAGLGQIDVTIDGATHSMYALGLRVTYPTGTCFESLFSVPWVVFGDEVCSPPPFGLMLVLWQTRSGSRPPDRMVLISADVGTASFDFQFPGFGLDDGPLPPPTTDLSLGAFAAYIEPREEFWTSVGGSLTSQVAATSETCAVTPPPFAKSSTCHIAAFDESGSITLERLDYTLITPTGGAAPSQTMEIVIPRQTVFGIVQEITEIRPVTYGGPSTFRPF